jgi:hypothetical protein
MKCVHCDRGQNIQVIDYNMIRNEYLKILKMLEKI